MKPDTYTPFFSVFTPTYNRKDLLERVRQSLVKQTYRNFEWIIVDDGSTDQTGELVAGWEAESDFPIRYFYKKNGGKHTAVNFGVEQAAGVLLVEVDSDDWLLPEALETLFGEWQSTADRESLFGVTGLCLYEDGKIIGDKYPEDRFISNPVDLRFIHRIRGDKTGANRIDVLREFKFPDIDDRYIPESLIWNRIAQQYDTLFINKPIGVKEYQPTGITANANLNSLQCARSYYLLNKELLSGNKYLPAIATVRCLLTGLKCAVYSKSSPLISQQLWHRLLSFLLLPVVGVSILRDFVRHSRKHIIKRFGFS